MTQTRPLLVGRDPRLTDVTDADLQKQFVMAMQIQGELNRTHGAVIRIRSLKSQLQKAAASNASIAGSAAAIAGKLDEIEADLYQVKNRSPRDTLNYPIKLNNQIAVLQRIVDTGDYQPTDQDRQVFLELTARLNAILARLDEVTARDLKQLNEKLAALKLPAITF